MTCDLIHVRVSRSSVRLCGLLSEQAHAGEGPCLVCSARAGQHVHLACDVREHAWLESYVREWHSAGFECGGDAVPLLRSDFALISTCRRSTLSGRYLQQQMHIRRERSLDVMQYYTVLSAC